MTTTPGDRVGPLSGEHRRRVAVVPDSRPAMYRAFCDAVVAAGAEPSPPGEASAWIWADPDAAGRWPELLGRGPGPAWVQLPYAGIEPFAAHLDRDRLWTCGKGVYAEPVAEWVMAALLTGLRSVHRYAGARSWGPQVGRNLLGARLTVLGGGGITRSLLRLLEPWGCEVTVVRRRPEPVSGATATVGPAELHAAVRGVDAVVVALALTPATTGIVDAAVLEAMGPDAWLVNVGRGAHVVTDDLVAALRHGVIAGAVLDVTDPEPLPDHSPLWSLPDCVITPHVGNTPEMGLPLITARVADNVARWLDGRPLVGTVDVDAGY